MNHKHTATVRKRLTIPQRQPFNQMAPEEVRAWLLATRSALQQKMQRERAYLDRRAARGTCTPAAEANARDHPLEEDLQALLDEIATNLLDGKEP